MRLEMQAALKCHNGIEKRILRGFHCLLVGTILLVLCGCTSHYVMRLNNGMTVTTSSKPKLKDGYYTFKDPLGRTNYVAQSRVSEIEPASMAAEEDSHSKPSYPKPKNHWWQFWR